MAGLRVIERVNKSPSQNSITMTTVHNLPASLLSKCLQKFKISNRDRAPERLNYYINMRRKKKKSIENDNKSKFLRYFYF